MTDGSWSAPKHARSTVSYVAWLFNDITDYKELTLTNAQVNQTNII